MKRIIHNKKMNEKIEACVMQIAKLEIEHGKKAVYYASRRYNDRIMTKQ